MNKKKNKKPSTKGQGKNILKKPKNPESSKVRVIKECNDKPNSKCVYCKKCAFFLISMIYNLEECEAPGNYKGDYANPKAEKIMRPEERNKDNKCELYKSKYSLFNIFIGWLIWIYKVWERGPIKKGGVRKKPKQPKPMAPNYHFEAKLNIDESKNKIIKELSKLNMKHADLELKYNRLVTEIKKISTQSMDVLFYPQSRKYIEEILNVINKIIDVKLDK